MDNYSQYNKDLDKIETFEKINQKYISLHKKYADLYDKLSKDIGSKVFRREYAKGGECIHRGFYSPSLMDLTTGGMNRGRLLKKIPIKNNCSYEYLFDKDDKLICVYKYSEYNASEIVETELLIYQEDKVLSLMFDMTVANGLSVITECLYESGKLMRYEKAHLLYFRAEEGCVDINIETHDYEDDLMKSYHWYCYTPSINLLTHYKYTFTRDTEGYLSTYTVKKIGGSPTKYVWETNINDCETNIYHVLGKQKK